MHVHIPAAGSFAPEVIDETLRQAKAFLKRLPHHYYEENNLHAALIIYGRYSYEETLDLIGEFLPFIDNWATCDMFVPAVLGKNKIKTREFLHSLVFLCRSSIRTFRVC